MSLYKSANEYITNQFMKKTLYERFDDIFNLEEPKDFLNFINIGCLNRIMNEFKNKFNNNVLIKDIDKTNKDEIIRKIIEIVKTAKYYITFDFNAPKTAAEAYSMDKIEGYEFQLKIVVYLISDNKNTIDIIKNNEIFLITFSGFNEFCPSDGCFYIEIDDEIIMKYNCEDLQFIEICNFIFDNNDILNELDKYPLNNKPGDCEYYSYYDIIEKTIGNEKNKMIKKLKNSGLYSPLLDNLYINVDDDDDEYIYETDNSDTDA